MPAGSAFSASGTTTYAEPTERQPRRQHLGVRRPRREAAHVRLARPHPRVMFDAFNLTNSHASETIGRATGLQLPEADADPRAAHGARRLPLHLLRSRWLDGRSAEPAGTVRLPSVFCFRRVPRRAPSHPTAVPTRVLQFVPAYCIVAVTSGYIRSRLCMHSSACVVASLRVGICCFALCCWDLALGSAPTD